MRLLLSSTAIAAVSTSLLLEVKSATAAVGIAYSESLVEECSFASFGLRGHEADAGILSCTEGYVCVEDGRSSLGGHCVSVNTVHRDLQDTQPCNTKCEGEGACDGLTEDFKNKYIGERSCCGKFACRFVSGK